MADEVNENIFLVNAPAGSGKTTWIRQQVESYLLRNPKDNILCITYTNRAAEELGRDLEQSRVYFGTIHSFINDFIGSFFSHKEIIDLYWEVYETQIIERIKNTEIVNLFPPKSGELSGINYISNLLWALEILAWSPEYLVHSISVLGLLEALPYERTNWTNTPINSIVSILLPWYPQTMADLEKRKNALKCLKTDNPRVFWSTLKKLLPNKTRSTSGNPRPKYLKLEIPEEVKVT